MRKILMCLSLASLLLTACGGTKNDDPDALDNALVAFTACVQGARWAEALENVTPDEAYAIATADGSEFKEEYMLAARRLPLSTLRKTITEVDGSGRLIGIKAALDEANERTKMSADQAKVGTDLQQKEDERIKRRLEEGQRLLQEEAEAANQEQEEIVYSNKLTDEEKQKYSNTGDALAGERERTPEEQAVQDDFDAGAVGGDFDDE